MLGGLYTFVMVIPSTSVVVHFRSFVGDEDAMVCHLSELLTSVATPCTLLLVYAARL